MLDLDEARGLSKAEAVDLLEGGSGLREVTAVHVAPGEVSHLPVHPGHGGAHVSAQLCGGLRGVGVVKADEGHSRVGLLKFKMNGAQFTATLLYLTPFCNMSDETRMFNL